MISYVEIYYCSILEALQLMNCIDFYRQRLCISHKLFIEYLIIRYEYQSFLFLRYCGYGCVKLNVLYWVSTPIFSKCLSYFETFSFLF